MYNPKVILVIMDGWGYSPVKKGNAILEAKTPNFDYLWNNYSHTLLNAFGENVGLPWGSIGSAEVGHTSIGSGRLINQELSLIDKEVANGNFYTNRKILKIIDDTKKSGCSIHLAGLVSKGGVHSQMEHLFALLRLFKAKGLTSNIFIHVFTDGRDTSPSSAVQYIAELQKVIKKLGLNAKITTLSGRFFAMDRDNRWDRTKKAYLTMTELLGKHSSDPISALKEQYDKKVSDEFIEPIIIDQKESSSLISKLLGKKPEALRTGRIEENDSLIFFNIRPDRMRQISEMFLFERKDLGTSPVSKLKVLTLTTYNKYLPVEVAYPSEIIENPLAKILSDHGVRQGHFAETEKYAHVTYFFNGRNPEPYPKETWHLVSSPKVLTYDLKPEMSASQLTKEILKSVDEEKLDFVLINYANADMVGHTGIFPKVVAAVEAVDEQIGTLLKTFTKSTILVTADHGNAECMIHPETGEIDKTHTVNPVPFIIVNDQFKKKNNPGEEPKSTGILADIAPTVLHFFNLEKDKNMNGISLIEGLK